MSWLYFEEVLREYESWGLSIQETPRLVKPLTEGRTNRNFLIKANTHYYRLRINNSASDKLGINRIHEQVIHKHIDPLGISPRLLHVDSGHRYGIFEFYEARVWQPDALEKKENKKRLEQLIDSYQALTLPLPEFSYFHHISKYYRELQLAGLKLGERRAIQTRTIFGTIRPAAKSVAAHFMPPRFNATKHSRVGPRHQRYRLGIRWPWPPPFRYVLHWG